MSSQESLEPSQLSELRRILLGLSPEEIASLKNRLDNPNLRAKEISVILSDAVRMSTSRDDKLSRTLSPLVEGGVRTSIEKNPDEFADLLAPIMGPAIRTSIVNAIREHTQSIDRVLQQSVSAKGLLWRFEAMRSGRSFADVALFHSLDFRVENVFLIHKETSLPLCEVSLPGLDKESPESVSGMLSAIRDFVNDSFGVEQAGGLGQMQVGDLTVLIGDGSQALIAAVVRGTAPEGFRNQLLEALDVFHFEYKDHMRVFQGDTLQFELFKPKLEELLLVEFKESIKKSSSASWRGLAALVLISIAGLWWAFSSFREQRAWEKFTSYLESLPGIVLTEHTRDGDTHFIKGLRDPLAADPVKIFQNQGLDGRLITSFDEYYSTDREILKARVIKRLDPPKGVKLDIKSQGKLVAEGQAEASWIDFFDQFAPNILGVQAVDREKLNISTSLEEKLRVAVKKLEQQFISYQTNQTETSNLDGGLRDPAKDFGEVVSKARVVSRLAGLLNMTPRFTVKMHSGGSGSQDINNRLYHSRADDLLKRIESKAGDLPVSKLSRWQNDDPQACKRFPAWCGQTTPIIYLDTTLTPGK